MNGEPELMKMPSCLNKKLKDGMTREYKNDNLTLVIVFYYTILISDSLQGNFSLNGKGHISSKKFITPEPSK